LTVEELKSMNRATMRESLLELAYRRYEEREDSLGSEQMRELERLIMLRVVDSKWMDHLDAMDDLRQGVGLRAFGQRDPLLEYKFEAFEMFQEMVNSIQDDIVRYIYRVQIVSESPMPKQERVMYAGEPEEKRPVKNTEKFGRNDPCPCGSGKKYKRCCGK
jgi:preprotein translocase subunit SecA